MSRAKSLKKVRVGVVGLGMGRHHVMAYQKHPRCEVTAICDVDESRLTAVASELNVPHTFTDPKKLFQSGEVDAVSIATPNTLHAPLTIAALKAGLHVLCEKPMAMSAAQAKQMVAAAKQARRKLAMHFNHRAQPGVQWIARAAQAGELGDIYFARTVWHRRRGIPGRASFLDKSFSGGGAMIDLGVHMLDQTLFIMGYPKVVSVSAATHTKFHKKDVPKIPMDVDDFATAYVRFANDATLAMEISWASHHNHAEQFLVQVYGTEGGARRLSENYQETAAEIYRRDHGGLSTLRMDAPPRDVVTVQADFVDAILDNREPAFSGEKHGLVTMQILDAIYESSRTGREVRVR
jgi:predicted dehydrogenase